MSTLCDAQQLSSSSSYLSNAASSADIRSRRAHVDLEIIVPAFNEASRLSRTLVATREYLATQSWTSRIVVVDNGSVDTTGHVARTAGGPRKIDISVIGCAFPGKGAAVRRGIMTSSARFVGFVDADMSTPIATLAEAIRVLEEGSSAAIGSRHAPGAKLMQRQPLARRLGGAAFRTLATRTVPGLHDTQCGFKFFERRAVQAALLRCTITGFAFDLELLHRIARDGGSIVEIPIEWTNDTGTTLRPVRDGVAAFRAVVALMAARG